MLSISPQRYDLFLPRGKFLLYLATTLFLPSVVAFVSHVGHHTSSLRLRSHTLVRVNSAENDKIPFLIERIPDQPNNRVYKEISAMCIEAFFNDEATGGLIPPWKVAQLSYLRGLQEGDLRRRRQKESDNNMMFVARRIVQADESTARLKPLLVDFTNTYNMGLEDLSRDYVAGEVLGFVEVTKKPYGLGSEKIGLPYDPRSKIKLRQSSFYGMRPVLTNLSVRRNARNSGIGSKLLDVCEREVAREWGLQEIILEVEDDNDNARRFYEKRGYKILFEDPSTRRYDLNGLWLREVRCKRQIMRKIFGFHVPEVSVVEVKSTVTFGIRVLQRLRDNVLSAVP